jgi:hypothetical protein
MDFPVSPVLPQELCQVAVDQDYTIMSIAIVTIVRHIWYHISPMKNFEKLYIVSFHSKKKHAWAKWCSSAQQLHEPLVELL